MNRPLVDARGTAVRGTLPQALTTSTLTSDRSAVRMGRDVTQRQSVDTPALTLVQKPRVRPHDPLHARPPGPGSPAWPHPPGGRLRGRAREAAGGQLRPSRVMKNDRELSTEEMTPPK